MQTAVGLKARNHRIINLTKTGLCLSVLLSELRDVRRLKREPRSMDPRQSSRRCVSCWASG